MIAPRLSRGLCLILGLGLGLGLLAGACNHEQAPVTTTSQSPSPPTSTVTPTPTPAVTPAVTTPPAASPTPSPTRKATPAPPKAGPTMPAPVATTAPAVPTAAPAAPTIAVPRPGTYTYDLSGTKNPVLGIAQPYPAGATLVIDIAHSGTDVVSTATSAQDQVKTTTKQAYQASKILLTFSNLTLVGLSSYDCTYLPPPEVLPIPLAAGTVPSQSWSGAQCSGTLQLSVLGAETVTAAGQTWNVWRVHTLLHYVAQASVDATMDSTTLFSPDLGAIITSDSTTSGNVAGSTFTNHQVTKLNSHP